MSQCASALTADREFERRRAHHQQVERSVLLVGGQQPVERQQARQQRTEPQDRGTDALEQREIRPDRERHQRHHGHKEQHADHRAAADPDRDPDVAHEQGLERAHAARSSLSSRASSMPERKMRCRDHHAAAGQMAAHQIEQHRLRGGIERRGRLVEQPERPLHGDEPRDREPALLPGREIGRRQAGQRVESDRAQRLERRLSAAAEPRGPEGEIFLDRERRVSGRRCGRGNAPVRRCCARRRRLQATTCRPRFAAGLRSSAAATTCRRRCGRSPAAPRRAATENPSPSKIERPPRWQHRACAERVIVSATYRAPAAAAA